MHRRSWPAVIGLAAGLAAMLTAPSARLLAQPPVPGAVPAAAPDALSAAQLDQLTAPIALYSDPLVAQILVAATYPLQVVEAHRWVLDPVHASLRGAALLAALQPQPWDLSVKSLVPFPQVLQRMDDDLQWTELIGEAFLAQQGAVMDSIQRLRQRAAAAGTLVSTPQQNISTLDQAILIDPASADEVYVPYYDPESAYGSWPWPDDPPCSFAPPAGVSVSGATPLVFGPGVVVLAPLWGWQRWNWRRHILDVALSSQPGYEQPWRHLPRRPGAANRGVTFGTSHPGARDLTGRTFAPNRNAQPVQPEGAGQPERRIPENAATSDARRSQQPIPPERAQNRPSGSGRTAGNATATSAHSGAIDSDLATSPAPPPAPVVRTR